MIKNQKIVVVMPAYNAEKTLRKTFETIPHDLVDDIILVDDCSWDRTVKVAEELGIRTVVHPQNKGYGANQKTCYQLALDHNADIVVMLHPDYQYDPRLVGAMASLIAEGVYDIVLGSRIISGGTLKGGMPAYKYISNRILTLIQNLLMGQKLSEYHTGYRAYHRKVLEAIPFQKNSDNFIFDNQFLTQAIALNFSIGEISCPTHYDADSSSIGLVKSLIYGFGVLGVSVRYLLHRGGILSSPLYKRRSFGSPSRSRPGSN